MRKPSAAYPSRRLQTTVNDHVYSRCEKRGKLRPDVVKDVGDQKEEEADAKMCPRGVRRALGVFSIFSSIILGRASRKFFVPSPRKNRRDRVAYVRVYLYTHEQQQRQTDGEKGVEERAEKSRAHVLSPPLCSCPYMHMHAYAEIERERAPRCFAVLQVRARATLVKFARRAYVCVCILADKSIIFAIISFCFVFVRAGERIQQLSVIYSIYRECAPKAGEEQLA